MLTTLLLLQLAAPTEEAHQAPRLRAGIGVAISGEYTPHISGGGLGFTAELGGTFTVLSLVGRVNFGTIGVLNCIQFGFALGAALTEHLELGGGLAASWVGGWGQDLPSAWAALVPVHLMFMPAARAPGATRRTGLAFFFAVAPGLMFAGSTGLPPIGPPPPPRLPIVVAATLGLGYAWW